MRRLSLGTLLIGANVGLVVLAVVGVVAAGSSLLRRLADEQAIARVRLAGSTARLAIELEAGHLQTAGHLLAERPDLERAVRERDAAAAGDSLAELRLATGLTACAILLDGKVFASSAGGVDWKTLVPGDGGPRTWIMGPAGPGGGLVLAALARLRSEPAALVATARMMDASFARDIAARAGMPVEIVPAREALEAESERAMLRGRAIDDAAGVAGRIDASALYLSVEPLRVPGGPVAAVVETTLPTAETDGSVRGLVHVLLAMAVVVGGLAAVFSVIVGRRLVGPLAELTRASMRIGGGDLNTPIPRPPGAETGDLAVAMEEMRGRLLDLTLELRQRRAAAEAVLTGIVEGVFAVDRERRIRYLNPQTAALLGIDPGDAVGRFCGDVLNPQGPDGVRPCDERCPIVHARFRGGARATEHLLLAGGGHRSVVITSAAPAIAGPREGPEPPGAARQFQVIRDETEVEATRRLRDTVLANITHEFRTPLSAQLASIELLRDRLHDLSAEEAGDLIAALERGTLRLTQLIDNLLESVRIDAGQGAIRRQPVALDDVLEEAVALTAPLIELRGQRLDVDLPHPMPALRGDAPRLVQVFVNLLANANKFAPAGSTIRIGGTSRPDEVALWVEDEGPGLPEGDGGLLFERFMRSPGEEPEESGMGLGLFIVKSIVERHGGRVEARAADHPGADERGTRMCVILPAGGAASGGASSGGAA
jgi:signal transduction histidine kinase/HAMP domain-containing protein